MFRKLKIPEYKLKNQKLLYLSSTLGLIILAFLNHDPFLLGLGIFLLLSSILIVIISLGLYLNKVKKYNLSIIRIKESNIHQIDHFSGEKFEFFLKKLFEDLGYINILTTQKTRDFGVDLKMFDSHNKKIIIQAKRYDSSVGIDAINEAVGTRLPEKADEVWVVTNSYFTKSAIKHAGLNNVKLINRDQLIELIMKSKL